MYSNSFLAAATKISSQIIAINSNDDMNLLVGKGRALTNHHSCAALEGVHDFLGNTIPTYSIPTVLMIEN